MSWIDPRQLSDTQIGGQVMPFPGGQQPDNPETPFDAQDPQAQQPQQATPESAAQAILELITHRATQTDLDVKLQADAVNTLATAVKSLLTSQAQGIHPQDQLALEQQKMQHAQFIAEQDAKHRQEMEKQRLAMEAEKAQLEQQRQDDQHAVSIEQNIQKMKQADDSHHLSLQQQQEKHQNDLQISTADAITRRQAASQKAKQTGNSK